MRIFREEGVPGLYRGLGPTLLGLLPTWTIYFYAYDIYKSAISDKFGIGGQWIS